MSDIKGSLPVVMKHPWVLASNEVQLETWRGALTASKGSVTLAAEAVGISRSQATRLNKKYGLGEFAAQLRLENGSTRAGGGRKGVVTGRPRKSPASESDF